MSGSVNKINEVYVCPAIELAFTPEPGWLLLQSCKSPDICLPCTALSLCRRVADRTRGGMEVIW